MYCSRRGIQVSRQTDACRRCGRCNWEQHGKQPGDSRIAAIVLIAAGIILAAAWILIR